MTMRELLFLCIPIPPYYFPGSIGGVFTCRVLVTSGGEFRNDNYLGIRGPGYVSGVLVGFPFPESALQEAGRHRDFRRARGASPARLLRALTKHATGISKPGTLKI